MRLAVVLIGAAFVLAVTAWWTAAMVIAGPEPKWVRYLLAAAFVAVSAVVLIRPRRFALVLWTAAFGGLVVWWATLAPSNDREWQPDVARVPSAQLRGNVLTVSNVRNFDYRGETDFTPRYEERTYDLDKLSGLDLFLSYWGSPTIAHTIMSWQFEGSPPLAVSIETRKHRGQEYSAIEGFFKQYEIIYLAADERDVVRLRTNHRNEEVYLYRLSTPVPRARALLMEYVASMNELIAHPQFYNALTENCTTAIYGHVKHIDPDASRLDWRLLANGYVDRLLYERRIVEARLPFAELRSRSLINSVARSADQDPEFSVRIRQSLPDPRRSEGGPLREMHPARGIAAAR